MIELRPARDEDVQVLCNMSIETQITTFGKSFNPKDLEAYIRISYDPAQILKEIHEPGSIYYIAWEDSEPVGFLRLRTTREVESFLGQHAIELQRLYVLDAHQGKKIGSILMQKAIDHARESKFEWLWLGVWENNSKAQEFYRKWNFERFSQHIFKMGEDDQLDWLLKLKL